MPDKSDQTIRDRIIHKCAELFAVRGFSKISMDEISRALGMSKKTIYKYFAGKDELVKTVILNFRDTTLSRIQTVLSDDELDFYMRLSKILEVTGEQLSKIQKPILEDLKMYMPEFWAEIEEKRRTVLRQVYGTLISEGKEAGIIRHDVDIDFFLLMYMNLVTSIVNPEVLSRIPYSPSQVFNNIVKTLFTGILTEEARNKYYGKYLS